MRVAKGCASRWRAGSPEAGSDHLKESDVHSKWAWSIITWNHMDKATRTGRRQPAGSQLNHILNISTTMATWANKLNDISLLSKIIIYIILKMISWSFPGPMKCEEEGEKIWHMWTVTRDVFVLILEKLLMVLFHFKSVQPKVEWGRRKTSTRHRPGNESGKQRKEDKYLMLFLRCRKQKTGWIGQTAVGGRTEEGRRKGEHH